MALKLRTFLRQNVIAERPTTFNPTSSHFKALFSATFHFQLRHFETPLGIDTLKTGNRSMFKGPQQPQYVHRQGQKQTPQALKILADQGTISTSNSYYKR